MGFVAEAKKKLLSGKMRACLADEIGDWHAGVILKGMGYDRLVSLCLAKGYNAEESILHVVGVKFSSLSSFDEAWALQILPPNYNGTYDRVKCADEWYVLARFWRDEGRVCEVVLGNFEDILDSTKSRFPELFSGTKPKEKSYWEVHYDCSPAGIATSDPSHNALAEFEEYEEAIKFVQQRSDEPLWWHSYDLSEKRKEGIIPDWEESTPPRPFSCPNERGRIGWNWYSREASPCLKATSKKAYVEWLLGASETNFISSFETNRNGEETLKYDLRSWTIRKVVISQPIDNSSAKKDEQHVESSNAGEDIKISTSDCFVEELKTLCKMFEDGLISEKEFASSKKKLGI